MKETTQQYIKNIRNWYHVIIGLSFGYTICLVLFSNRENFPISWFYWNNYALPPIVSFILLGIGSFLWERKQDKIKENSSDMRDVYVSAISGLLGGYIAMTYANIWIAVITNIIAIYILLKHYKK